MIERHRDGKRDDRVLLVGKNIYGPVKCPNVLSINFHRLSFSSPLVSVQCIFTHLFYFILSHHLISSVVSSHLSLCWFIRSYLIRSLLVSSFFSSLLIFHLCSSLIRSDPKHFDRINNLIRAVVLNLSFSTAFTPFRLNQSVWWWWEAIPRLFLLLWRHRDKQRCFIGGLCGSQRDPCQIVTLTVFLVLLQPNQSPFSLSLCSYLSLSLFLLLIYFRISPLSSFLFLERACGKAVESWKLFSVSAASVVQACRRCLPMFTQHRSHTSLT